MSRSIEAFQETLSALREGRIDVGESDNELAGHVGSLEALLQVAPDEIVRDLRKLRDIMKRTRDSGGISTLMVFRALEDPEIAGIEGRVTDFVAKHCGVQYGELGWNVDHQSTGKTCCPGWPRAGSPLTNNRFPYLLDSAGSNYFSTLFWSVPFVPAPPGFIPVKRGGRVTFRGQYPHARYFAMHPNGSDMNNLETLVDVDLDPDLGSVNPWREEMPEGAGRRYTAHMVFGPKPANPEPNTSYVGQRKHGGFNPLVFLIYRIYAADQGSLPPNSAGVPLPMITVYDPQGRVTAHFDECDPYPPGYTPPEDHSRFPALPVPDYRGARRAGTLDTKPNWGLPMDILSNKDVLYVSTYYSRQHGEVFVVRFKALKTASAKKGVPLWTPNLEARMWSACTYNFWNGANVGWLLDEDAPIDDDGFHTLVISSSENRPANATAENGVAWIDAGPFLDGQLTFRMVLGREKFLQKLRKAIDTGNAPAEVAPHVPQTGFCSKQEFEQGGPTGVPVRWHRR